MKLKIKNIILYPKDPELKARVIVFDENKVNVITGYSQRGKSAIIHIIDYCLGSSDCNIPIGKIRDKVDVFAINANIGDKYIFIARESPTGRSKTNMYYEVYENEASLSFSLEHWISNSSAFITNRDDIKNYLGQLAGFENISEKNNVELSPLDAPASFRDTTAFQFQTQNIIANPTTIFYNTDTFEHLKRLKTLFPLVLGYKSYDIIRSEKEIEKLETEENELTKKIEEVQNQYENWQQDIIQYYSSAVSLGLTANGLDISNASVDSIKDELIQILRTLQNGTFFQEGSTLRYTDNLALLDEQRLTTLRELDEQKVGLAKIEQFDRTKSIYIDNVVAEVDNRLKPIDWWLQQEGTNICPFCKSESVTAINDLLVLKDVQLSNGEIIEKAADKSFSFENEKIQFRNRIKHLETNLKKIEINIDLLLNENRQYYKQFQDIFEFVGEIKHVIENLNKIAPGGELIEKRKALVAEIAVKKINLEELKKKFDKNACLNSVAAFIGHYVSILPIEERQSRKVQLDPDNSVSIKIEDTVSRNITFLSKIGSGANHMGYHIATMLGLHEYFTKLPDSGKKNYIPSFLVLDQPSQVYFPEGYETAVTELKTGSTKEKKVSEDIKNTTSIFAACSEFMKKTKHRTQIIILEHAPESTWKNIENIHLVEEWRGDKETIDESYNALLPKEWL